MSKQSERAVQRMETSLAADTDAPKTRAEQFTMFKGKVEAILPAVATAMPAHVQPDRIVRTIMTAVRTTPALLDCTIDSLLAGTLVAAQLGLEIGPLGHAYLVPYRRTKNGKSWSEATFIIGYRGMLDLARRSGTIESIYAYPVYEGDTFEWELGMNPRLSHRPSGTEPDDTAITHFYAVAHLSGGGHQFEVMTKAQVDSVRARSKAKDSGPWVTDYAEMGRKTVMRRLFKWLPVSVEVQRAVSADETIRHGVAEDMLSLPDVSEAEDIYEGEGGQIVTEDITLGDAVEFLSDAGAEVIVLDETTPDAVVVTSEDEDAEHLPEGEEFTWEGKPPPKSRAKKSSTHDISTEAQETLSVDNGQAEDAEG